MSGTRDIPEEIEAIRGELRRFLNTKDTQGRRIGSAKGIYAFFDYDEEPIYVGQTDEGLSARIGRHLTNQRTDAVAMSVLDPFEVAFVEVWPLTHETMSKAQKQAFAAQLAAAEYTVFQKVLAASKLRAVLNEKIIPATDVVGLPPSIRHRIVPEKIFDRLSHPDLRIARRAQTIAKLAQVISERDVSAGLRRTLITQAQRLEKLATLRFADFSGQEPVETPGEETGTDAAE